MKIDPVCEVGFGLVRGSAETGHRDECQKCPIADQQPNNRDKQAAPIQIEKQDRRKQIADSNALQDADKAYVAQLADTAVIKDPQHVQDKCPSQYVQVGFRPSLALDQPR